MKDGPPAACNLAEKRECDYTLAAPGAAADNNDFLGVARARLFDAVQYEIDCKLLVAEELELWSIAYLSAATLSSF